jgi:hypothetical protein
MVRIQVNMDGVKRAEELTARNNELIQEIEDNLAEIRMCLHSVEISLNEKDDAVTSPISE